MGNIIKMYYQYILKCNLLLWLLQSSVSHDPSEIILICWFAAQGTYLILTDIQNYLN